MTIVDKSLYSQITLRTKPGVYIDIPIVDNRGIFEHFKCSGKESGYQLETFYLDAGNQYGIYKNDSGISYLVSAFASSADVGNDSLEIILNHFPFLLKKLNFDFKYDLHINIENLPVFYYELYLKVNGIFFLVSRIEDIDNLTSSEAESVKKFPGALERIKKTTEAFN
ncbi:hypothetical protein JAF86_003475 [Citrobacter braakii]|nr:hypothetical protein [Citrobacter braakii]ELK6840365.1 hypothetical protein [Citrobacter braakii]